MVGKNVIEISGYREDLEPFLKEKNVLYEKTPSRIIVFSKDSEHFFSEVSQKFCKSDCGLFYPLSGYHEEALGEVADRTKNA